MSSLQVSNEKWLNAGELSHCRGRVLLKKHLC